jgi:hypothetical protein
MEKQVVGDLTMIAGQEDALTTLVNVWFGPSSSVAWQGRPLIFVQSESH